MKNLSNNKKLFHGFTLFEVLVAVSIFALIAAMTMTNLIQVGQTGERVSESQRQLADIQFALGYFGKDLVQLINRKVRDQYGDEQPALILNDRALTFTRNGWSNLMQQERSRLQRVEYRLVDETLKRKTWAHLDQGYQEQVLEQPLLTGVEELEIALLTKGKEKLTSWPPLSQTDSSAQPVAVELTLELVNFGKIQRVYELSDALL